MNEDDASRRAFLGKLVGGSVLASSLGSIGSIVAYLTPPGEVRAGLGPQRVRVAREDEFEPGQGRLALVDEDPVWVVRVASGFVALSAVCTHKGCSLKWQDKRRLFICPCHEGSFDERGNVVSGLPRRPLSQFLVGVVDGEVYVSRANHSRA